MQRLSVTDDLRVQKLESLTTPSQLIEQIQPVKGLKTVTERRNEVERVLLGRDHRLMVVVGPCSIHDVHAGYTYARKLAEMSRRYENDILVVMRCYFEKPRTTVGWKGLINDPYLDGSFAINEGLRRARRFLCDVNDLGLGIGAEFLDPISPQFLTDLVSWGAIGARTSESQVHREMASGLSMPVGFKNGTQGDIQIAIDGVRAALHPHHFLGVSKEGRAAIVSTQGNPLAHVILRGGKSGPNYAAPSVQHASKTMQDAGLRPRLVVDCSHANSNKDPYNQPRVADAVAEQLRCGEEAIRGVMIESFLVAGRQNHSPGRVLTFGQSITDGCVDLAQTQEILEQLARATRERKLRAPKSSKNAPGMLASS